VRFPRRRGDGMKGKRRWHTGSFSEWDSIELWGKLQSFKLHPMNNDYHIIMAILKSKS